MKTVLVSIGSFVLGGLIVSGITYGVLDFTHMTRSNDNGSVAVTNSTTTNTTVPVVTNGNTNAGTNSNTNSVATNTNSGATENPHVPTQYSLDVPYTVQAPNGIWDLPYAEACEEASILMVGRYLNDRSITDAADADGAIVQLTQYVEDQGLAIDMTAEETAKVLADFYDVDTDVVYDFTWDQVKEALSSGYPIILPTAGQKLHNPHYQSPGPRYHMLVLTGYTTTEIITNDPGTKFGEGYAYTYATLDDAAHDWNGGNVDSGRRVMIVARPQK